MALLLVGRYSFLALALGKFYLFFLLLTLLLHSTTAYLSCGNTFELSIMTLQLNFDVGGGLCNRTRLTTSAVLDQLLHADTLTGVCCNEQEFILDMDLLNSETRIPFKL